MSKLVAALLAVAFVVWALSWDNESRWKAASIGLEQASYSAGRGPLRGTVDVSPPTPEVGEPVEVELVGHDKEGGVIRLAYTVDGSRPPTPTAAVRCAAASEGSGATLPPVPAAEATETHRAVFDRPGRHEVRLVVASFGCDRKRRTVEVTAEVDVRPA